MDHAYRNKKIAQVVVGQLALHNMEMAEAPADSDELLGARTEKHLSDSYNSMELRNRVEAILEKRLPANDYDDHWQLAPRIALSITKEISDYFTSIGFKADAKGIYDTIQYSHSQLQYDR